MEKEKQKITKGLKFTRIEKLGNKKINKDTNRNNSNSTSSYYNSIVNISRCSN